MEINTDFFNRVKNKDNEAINLLYNNSYKGATLTAKGYLNDNDDVQEVVQRAYIKAFNAIDSLDSINNFQKWLNKIVTNESLNYIKSRKYVIQFAEETDDDGDVYAIDLEDKKAIDPGVAISEQAKYDMLYEILDELPEKQRIVIRMYYFDDMTAAQIASELGVSQKTVESRLKYGKDKIVEKVTALEKREGFKMHTFVPFPFFLWLYRQFNITSPEITSAVPMYAQHTKPKKATKKKVVKIGKSAVSTKIVAGVVAGTVAIGGISIALSGNSSNITSNASSSATSPVIVSTAPEDTNSYTIESKYQLGNINDSWLSSAHYNEKKWKDFGLTTINADEDAKSHYDCNFNNMCLLWEPEYRYQISNHEISQGYIPTGHHYDTDYFNVNLVKMDYYEWNNTGEESELFNMAQLENIGLLPDEVINAFNDVDYQKAQQHFSYESRLKVNNVVLLYLNVDFDGYGPYTYVVAIPNIVMNNGEVEFYHYEADTRVITVNLLEDTSQFLDLYVDQAKNRLWYDLRYLDESLTSSYQQMSIDELSDVFASQFDNKYSRQTVDLPNEVKISNFLLSNYDGNSFEPGIQNPWFD